MRARTSLVALLLAALGAGVVAPDASAQPKGPPKITPPAPPVELVGVREVAAVVPERGFVDDPIATDGTRTALVVTDGAGLVEARVYGADGVSHQKVDLAAITAAPRRIYLTGERLLVVADEPSGAGVTATLVELSGKVVRRFPRATELWLRPLAGKEVVVAYDRAEVRGATQHQVAVLDLATGKRLPRKGGKVVVGADGRDGKLDLKVAYWLDDHTVVGGTKGGVWRKREDQRSPDTEAAYDLISGKWVRDQPIPNLLAYARRLEILSAHADQRHFVHVGDSGLEVWRDGAVTPLTLDQPYESYDVSSLRVVMKGDRLWMSLVVDPVNPAAVARQKADTEYLDVFEIDGGRATRRARLLAAKKKLAWGWSGDRLWVMEKNQGFSRGGKSLRFFELAP